MDKFGLIGHPIAHSVSPRAFKAAYAGKYPYELIEDENFDSAWSRFLEGYKGINVTAPFKIQAYEKADWRSEACQKIGASNLCIQTPQGVKAYNSDFLGVRKILETTRATEVAIIGFGGAGKAALAAAESLGLSTKLYRHSEISEGLESDTVIYTLPKAVKGIDRIHCRQLLEANYKDPCLSSHEGYISGLEWLQWQAILGYKLMTGIDPDEKAIRAAF